MGWPCYTGTNPLYQDWLLLPELAPIEPGLAHFTGTSSLYQDWPPCAQTGPLYRNLLLVPVLASCTRIGTLVQGLAPFVPGQAPMFWLAPMYRDWPPLYPDWPPFIGTGPHVPGLGPLCTRTSNHVPGLAPCTGTGSPVYQN